MNMPDTDPTVRAGNIMMLFAVMNLLFCAVLISAPLIANTLVTNAPAAAGIVAPFAAAALAAGVATIKGRDAMGRGMGGGAGGGSGGGGSPKRNISGGPTARQTYTPRPAQQGSVVQQLAGGGDGGGDAPPAAPTSAGGGAKQAKTRRGAIITQQRRNKGKPGA
jgi:hypothetical protein